MVLHHSFLACAHSQRPDNAHIVEIIEGRLAPEIWGRSVSFCGGSANSLRTRVGRIPGCYVSPAQQLLGVALMHYLFGLQTSLLHAFFHSQLASLLVGFAFRRSNDFS